MDAKISVIIPAYNIQEYLGPTLDSVLAQTYENLEIIIVNDGSKDDTGVVADTWATKDSRIRVIHKENGGVTSARLRGVAEATGEWIGFVDGDDIVESEMYARLLYNALQYNAQISHCGYQMVFPNGRIDYYYNTGRLVKQDRISGLKDLIVGSYIEPGLCNKLFHKTLFHSLLHGEAVDTSIIINEDLLMNYHLFKAAECAVFEDFCPYHYVLRKGSAATSKVNEHKLWDPLRVMQMILEDAPDEVKPVAFQRLIRQLIGGATMDDTENPKLIIPFRSYARKELRTWLKTVLRDGESSIKLKAMAFWAAVWPWSYYVVHKYYAHLRGTDKKYEIK